jgi:hypothetical protein
LFEDEKPIEEVKPGTTTAKLAGFDFPKPAVDTQVAAEAASLFDTPRGLEAQDPTP